MTSVGHAAEIRPSLSQTPGPADRPRLHDDAGQPLDALVGAGVDVSTLYLVHGGRLRVMDSRGQSAVRDGLPPAVDTAGLDRLVTAVSNVRLRVPIRRDERSTSIVGILDAVTRRPSSIDVAAVTALARAYADQLSAPKEAVGPVALRRFARHAVGLTAAGSWDEAVAKLTDAALDLSGMTTAVVAVPDDRPGSSLAGRWRVCAAAGPLTAALASVPSSVLEALVGDVGAGASCWTTGHRDAGLDLGEEASESIVGIGELRRRGADAACVVPLAAQGQCVGLLVLADEGPAHLASTMAAEVLELLAAVGAGALRTLDALHAVSDMATRDPLTGLGHHASYFDDLRRALTTAGTGTVAVLTLDIDHFKEVNDTHGHLWGDSVLRATAATMSDVLRNSDRAYRLGGDEFAAVLAVQDADHARAVGARLLAHVRARLSPVTASLGIAVAVHGDSAESLTGRADAALYAAKRQGRDDWVASDTPHGVAAPRSAADEGRAPDVR